MDETEASVYLADKIIASYLIVNDLTTINIDLVDIISNVLVNYAESKEEYDEMITTATKFEY